MPRPYMSGPDTQLTRLRGVDLNHRPLGYEAIDLLLSSSIYGTSGIVRNRKEASGERFGSRMGVGFDRLRLWV